MRRGRAHGSRGHAHDGSFIVWQERDPFLIDARTHAGKEMWSAVRPRSPRNSTDARTRRRTHGRRGGECPAPRRRRRRPRSPPVRRAGASLDCEFIAGCDGFHGVSRRAWNGARISSAPTVGWLSCVGAPPVGEVIYARHERASRSLAAQSDASRYYIQCGLERGSRTGRTSGSGTTDVVSGRYRRQDRDRAVDRKVDSAVAQLRRRADALWPAILAGDAAHIVPPTGAKGLNLAISDVFYLARAFAAHFSKGDDRYLETYSDTALRRVWASERFSWWLTKLLHVFPDDDAFETRVKLSELIICSDPCTPRRRSPNNMRDCRSKNDWNWLRSFGLSLPTATKRSIGNPGVAALPLDSRSNLWSAGNDKNGIELKARKIGSLGPIA